MWRAVALVLTLVGTASAAPAAPGVFPSVQLQQTSCKTVENVILEGDNLEDKKATSLGECCSRCQARRCQAQHPLSRLDMCGAHSESHRPIRGHSTAAVRALYAH